MLGEKIGEESGKITVQRVLPIEGQGPPRVEVSFEGMGTILGENHTNLGTYISTLRPDGTLFGEGQGVVMTGQVHLEVEVPPVAESQGRRHYEKSVGVDCHAARWCDGRRDCRPPHARRAARETFSIAGDPYWALFRAHTGRVTLKENHVWRAPDLGTEHTNGRPFTGTAVGMGVL